MFLESAINCSIITLSCCLAASNTLCRINLIDLSSNTILLALPSRCCCCCSHLSLAFIWSDTRSCCKFFLLPKKKKLFHQQTLSILYLKYSSGYYIKHVFSQFPPSKFSFFKRRGIFHSLAAIHATNIWRARWSEKYFCVLNQQPKKKLFSNEESRKCS